MLKFHTHLEYLSNYTTVTKEQKTTVSYTNIQRFGVSKIIGGVGERN